MSPHGESSLPGGVALPLALFLVFANAVFVAAEFALVQSRRGQLQEQADKGSRTARLVLDLLERLDENLAVCQVGVTLASLGLGWLGEPAFAAMFRWLFSPTASWIGAASLSISIGASFLFITFLHVVLGEQVPKYAAIASAERISKLTAWPVRVTGLITWPLVYVLNGTAQLVLRPFGLVGVNEAGVHGAEEIRHLLAHSVRQGRISLLDVDLIENLFRFSRRRVREIMIPRSRTATLDAGWDRQKLLEALREEGFSRYPVVDGDLDQVIGVVHVKDLFPALLAADAAVDLHHLARPMMLVPDTLPVERLLRRFQRGRVHMALAVDEYGGIAGIVTLEDVLEELVGELRDEFDEEERDPVQLRPGGGYVLDPLLPIDLVAELVEDPPEPPEGISSVAGMIQEGLGRLPASGDRIPFGSDHELVASQVQGTQIVQVELVPSPKRSELAESEPDSAKK